MHPKTKEQLSALKAVAKALKVPFEKKDVSELSENEKTINLYGKDFVDIMEQSIAEAKAGKLTKIRPSDIWNLV